MSALLFVYGTLQPASTTELGKVDRTRLAAESDDLGAATTRGWLVDLGAYPALIEGDDVVHGRLLRLQRPQTAFVWLDAYEGVTGAAADEYTRDVRRVLDAHGRRRAAWMYLARRVPRDLPILRSGRWEG